MRIGFGHDVHPLVQGRPLIIGGVHIPFEKGAAGHSDADVLIHAIIDALLGAAGLPDIGNQFPNTDARYKDIDSKQLLAETMLILRKHAYGIGNIDTTVCLEKPPIAKFIPQIIATLCDVMKINPARLSVKAKTGEGLGFIGRGEGIAAYAAALITQ